MKTTAIPERSRDLVKIRDRHRCVRCLIPAPTGHWHHRRGRAVRGPHQHCPCNGVWLCSTCHVWAHANPEQAREVGLIVPRFVLEPGTQPFRTPTGWVKPDCEGGWTEAF